MSTARLEPRAAARRNDRLHITRHEELIWLLLASGVLCTGFLLLYFAKAHGFAESQSRLAAGSIVNLNAVPNETALLAPLGDVASGQERIFLADRIENAVRDRNLPRVGVLGTLRVQAPDLRGKSDLSAIADRLSAAERRREEAKAAKLAHQTAIQRKFGEIYSAIRRPDERPITVPLLTPQQLANIKPLFIVRTPAQFRSKLLLSLLTFFLSFYALHLFWRWRGFNGDNILLPVIHMLTGIGLMLMISMRDPLRDSLTFVDFGFGVAAGALAMGLLTLPDYERYASRFSYIFFAGAFLLGVLLAIFGHGPGSSDAKVNLFFFQPVELIRLLLVFFLAGYFGRNWDMLRDLRERRPGLATVGQRLHIPRLDYLAPVAICVGLSLAVFFLLKDNGPALVLGCLFLILYAIARKRSLGALAGLFVIVLGFAAGHAIGVPETVKQRVDMWLNPWDNTLRNGDQLAHSLWALSSGAATGTGLGLGDPASIPEGYTDLILSATGEELGFLGLLCVFTLYGVLVYRAFRIALRAPESYSFFLVSGLTLAVVLQAFLIAGGILDLIPLSGVVSPFLSFGKSSMIANFAAFGVILAVSSKAPGPDQARNFGAPMRVLAVVILSCLAIVIGRAAWFGVAKADSIAIRAAEVRHSDGQLALEYNPRIQAIKNSLPRGDIYDRNGIPLATSDMAVIAKHRDDYAKLGVAVDQNVSEAEKRHYPLGPQFFYLVGDVRTNFRQGARNLGLQEKDSRTRLQGFDDRREMRSLRDPETGRSFEVNQDDYRELLPLLRHRYDPDNKAVKAVLSRTRDVHMSIDARLQMRVSALLRNALEKTGKRGAAIVLDPGTGDLLASVSYPWPTADTFAAYRANPDFELAERYQDLARYGFYPPGSSFKIVTAVAALKKNPALASTVFRCISLPDGRVGNYVGKSKRPIRDDPQDHVPHGDVDMAKGIVVSCNAYFAQLGYREVGAQALWETAKQFDIPVARPNTAAKLQESLPQSAYGQGQVTASPFRMARVAATIANGGRMPEGRWVLDESNTRLDQPLSILSPGLAAQIGGYMRQVVASPAGTGRVLRANPVPIAGKTGTAQASQGDSHAWFIGYAPYRPTTDAASSHAHQIAFAVLVEHGQYGGKTAAPIAGQIVTASRELGLIP